MLACRESDAAGNNSAVGWCDSGLAWGELNDVPTRDKPPPSADATACEGDALLPRAFVDLLNGDTEAEEGRNMLEKER
jgi:hypothetical protein